MIKVMTIFGTRPEAIKMAPLVKKMELDSEIETITVVTGQHREMLDQVLDFFDLVPDFDLDIMSPNQTLKDITLKIINRLDTIIDETKPDIILVHGDTTTTFAASLIAFYKGIKIGHVEAGLRTFNTKNPFPEEANRQLTDVLADIYFAPTEISKLNLIKENKKIESIFVTGNTAIDAMEYTIKKDYDSKLLEKIKDKKIILFTTHRRENLGKPMIQIFQAINNILEKFEDVTVIFPMHKNSKIRNLAKEHLINSERLYLIEPLEVIDFHNLAKHAYIILTDSGGVQEEAPSLGIPVLVLRETTERPEGIEAGTLKLVGTDSEKIFKETETLLTDNDKYDEMSKASNPYGDGKASIKIIKIIKEYFYNKKLSGESK